MSIMMRSLVGLGGQWVNSQLEETHDLTEQLEPAGRRKGSPAQAGPAVGGFGGGCRTDVYGARASTWLFAPRSRGRGLGSQPKKGRRRLAAGD
jgi:hypothetical protein